MVLDVRGRASHRAGTLPGAIYAGTDPAGFLPDGRGGEVLLVMPQPSSPGLERAWGRRLGGYGFDVRVLEGGFEAWQAAGLPVEMPGETHVRPGSVPFTIPRGLCETNPPAQVFE